MEVRNFVMCMSTSEVCLLVRNLFQTKGIFPSGQVERLLVTVISRCCNSTGPLLKRGLLFRFYSAEWTGSYCNLCNIIPN